MRLKAGGVRFLGCFPVYDYDAAIGSSATKSARSLQLHHDCCRVLSDAIFEFCRRSVQMRAGNGLVYDCVPRFAFISGDYEEVKMHVALCGCGCYLCECPAKRLDVSNRRWPLRSLGPVMRSMASLANDVLDDDGKVIRGMGKRIEDWERTWRMKFIDNGFARLLGVDFDVLLGCPRDMLHHILLGLFGQHIVNAIMHLLEQALADPLYWQSGGQGNPALMNHEKMNAIWTRLADRLAQIIQDESGYTITAKMAKHFLKVNMTKLGRISRICLQEGGGRWEAGVPTRNVQLHWTPNAPLDAGFATRSAWNHHSGGEQSQTPPLPPPPLPPLSLRGSQ